MKTEKKREYKAVTSKQSLEKDKIQTKPFLKEVKKTPSMVCNLNSGSSWCENLTCVE